MTSKTVSLFSLLVFASTASLADQVPMSEQRFELKWGSNSDSATRSYQSFTKENPEKHWGEHGEVTLRSPCEFGDIQEFRCYVTDWGVRYLPPFPTALPHRTPDLPGNEIDREWAPISEVYDGPKVLERWQQLARSGEPFDCKGPICHLIVQGVSKDNSETYYAVCQVAKVKAIVGAPEQCHQIIIVTKQTIWLQAITGSSVVKHKVGLPDFTYTVHGVPPEYKLPSNDPVLKELQKAFQHTKIALISELYEENTLIANASYRVSPILPGWREIVTVRVDLRRTSWSEPAFLGVTISTTLYVNRQNTDRPQDWQLPSEQQETQYLSEIRNRMKEALEALCIQTNWRNPDELICKVTP